jgi:hypothetical protein
MMNFIFAKKVFHPLVWVLLTIVLFLATGIADAYAHGVAEGDQGYVQEVSGVQFMPFMYLGAKHMVTPDTTICCSCSASSSSFTG